MANKRKNFIREKRIYCGEEYLEVDIVASCIIQSVKSK